MSTLYSMLCSHLYVLCQPYSIMYNKYTIIIPPPHQGKAIDDTYTGQPQDETDIILSDDDDDNLDKVDTMLHFGGGKFDKSNPTTDGYYGASSSGNGGGTTSRDMGDAYRSRKQELEERILHKKLLKAEKMKRKEDQVETFETMDESFAELAGLLDFRDKERERVEKSEKRKKGMLDADEMEMDAWDKEMKVRKRVEREREKNGLFGFG